MVASVGSTAFVRGNAEQVRGEGGKAANAIDLHEVPREQKTSF